MIVLPVRAPPVDPELAPVELLPGAVWVLEAGTLLVVAGAAAARGVTIDQEAAAFTDVLPSW